MTKLKTDPEKDKFDPKKLRKMPCAWKQCTTTTVTQDNKVGMLQEGWDAPITVKEKKLSQSEYSTLAMF